MITLLRCIAATLLMASFASVQAATITWEFARDLNNGSEQGSGYDNSYVFDSAGQSLGVTAWADMNTGTFQAANVTWFDEGLGVCNEGEGKNLAKCTSRANDRQTDNRGGGQQDWLLMTLPSDALHGSIIINPQGNSDRDVTYWVGTITDPYLLKNQSYSDLGGLGFGEQINVANSNGSDPITISLADLQGNAILFGAELGGSNDAFMINALSATFDPAGPSAAVPAPSAVYLFASGLGLLGFVRRRIAA